MTDAPRPAVALDAETLLAHSQWLARFARALVTRADEADDVVQQTFAQALARPPQHAGNLRGWLATIARNVVRAGSRSAKARAAREIAVPAPTPVETPEEAVARAELRKQVVEAVLALEEPYRSTVVLRYFEEQDVDAIGRLTSANENTVRTRLRRGLQRVRAQLERRTEEESRGAADEGVTARALLYLRLRAIARDQGGGGASDAAAPRGLARGRVAARAAAVLLFAGAIWWTLRRDGAPPAATENARSGDAARRAAPEVTPAPVAAVRSEETPRAEPAAEAPPPAAAEPTMRGAIRGRVTDASGAPVAGARVWAIAAFGQRSNGIALEFAAAAWRAIQGEKSGQLPGNWIARVSDADGRYEFADVSKYPAWEIGACSPDVGATVSELVGFDRRHDELAVDVALLPGSQIRGIVTSEDGTPLGGAMVSIIARDASKALRSDATTVSLGPHVGRFDFGFRCAQRFEVECRAPGFEPLPRGPLVVKPSQTELTFTLRRCAGTLVTGRVVDPAGREIDLFDLVATTLVATDVSARPKQVALRATPDDAAAGAPIDGRYDYVAKRWEIVVPDGFAGTLELLVSGTRVGTARLDDPADPPDLPCDRTLFPVPAAGLKVPVEFVDAETRLPIDLEHESPQQASYGANVPATLRADSDLRHGIVRYGCVPGRLLVFSLVDGYEPDVFVLDVPEQPPAQPLRIALAPAFATIRGRIVALDGKPSPRAGLVIYRQAPEGLVAAASSRFAANLDGDFERKEVARGPHVLVASGGDELAPAAVRFDVVKNTVVVELRRAPGVLTKFHVVAPETRRVANDTTYAIEDASGVPLVDTSLRYRERVDPFDDFAVPLAPGRHTVIVRREGFRERRQLFDVPANGTIDVAIEPIAAAEPLAPARPR